MRMVRAVYRVLLRTLPREVRRETGEEMETAFVACVDRECARRGRAGRVFGVTRGLIDLAIFVLRVRLGGWISRPAGEQRVRRPNVIMRDIRQTARLMRSQPLMAAAIVFMFALGIGATTAIFSVVYGVLLRPLPFPETERLVEVFGYRPDKGWGNVPLTAANFWDIRDRNRVFEEIGTWRDTSFSLTGFEYPERVDAAQVSTGFLRALGVRPVAGRLFEPGEDEQGRGESIAVVSHGFWTRRLGADPSAVGRTLVLDGRSYTVLGVLPAGSPFLDAAEVFIPFIRRANANRGSFEYVTVGRIKLGVSVDQARADLQRVAKELEVEYPKDNTRLGAVLEPSSTWIASDDLRRTLWILLGSVGLLLVIACVNVTNLLLARASARARDSAVRTALGASRADLVRERLTESLFYSPAGPLVGLVFAQWMITTLKSLDPGGIPRLAEVGLNGWVVAFSAGMALIVGVLTGLVPALRAPVGDIVPALRAGQRGSTGDRTGQRVRNVLVAAEVALSLMLLVGAGLLVRSLTTVLSVDRGFQSENRLLITVNVPRTYEDARMVQVNATLLERLQQLPGVASAAIVSGRPLAAGSTGLGIGAADQPDVAGNVPWATWRIVTKDYFKTMGLPLLSGRNFTEQDILSKPWRAIISKRTADLLWPGQNPIGRTAILWKGQSDNRGEVIGVVADMRERGLEEDPTLAVYFPAYGAGFSSMQIIIHTQGRPKDLVAAVRTTVTGVDAGLPVSNIRTLDEMISASVATRRMTMLLLAIFASLALVLALAGVYGVLAYSVARRTAEIGVRIALGAQHNRVLRLVIAQGLRPVAAGVVIGLAATYWLSRLMTSLLFGVTPRDPATYLGVVAAIAIVGALACYLPARRVLRIDPASALRAE